MIDELMKIEKICKLRKKRMIFNVKKDKDKEGC